MNKIDPFLGVMFRCKGCDNISYSSVRGSSDKEKDTTTIRTFNTGANRNSDENKLDFEGFLSPLVLKSYAEYMHKNTLLEDGTRRDSDNWQKGIPLDAYMKSMYRHFFDVWSRHRGLSTPEVQKQNLCGLLFNVMGMLHELIKEEAAEPTN